MADEADMTGDREELERAVWEKKRQQQQERRAVSEDCAECGEEIPLQRQQATGGTELCFTCAQKAEAKRRHYR